MVADDHHSSASTIRQLAEHSHRPIEPGHHALGGSVPFRSVDPRLVDVQKSPDAMLERIQVLKLNHQSRPVWGHLVGEQASASAGFEDEGGLACIRLDLLERPRRSLPHDAEVVARDFNQEPGGEFRRA